MPFTATPAPDKTTPSGDRFLVEAGTIIHIHGIPLYLDAPALVRTHAANIPLIRELVSRHDAETVRGGSGQ